MFDPANSVFGALLLNASVLLSLGVVLDLFSRRPVASQGAVAKLAVGLATGALGVAVMLAPYHLAPGIQFDTRSVVLAISGLFFGPLATGVAMALTAAFRVYLGGAAAATGVMVVVASGLLGLVFRRRYRNALDRVRWPVLLLLGLSVHVVMLALMFTIPGDAGPQVVRAIALPVLILHPAATVMLGLLVVQRLRRAAQAVQLARRKAEYRNLFESHPRPMWVYDLETLRFLEVNDAAVANYGYTRDEFLAMTIEQIRPAEDVPRLLSSVARVCAGEREGSSYWRHLTRDGRSIDVEVTSHSIQFEGRSARMVMASDVTAMRRAQLERERLVAAIDQSPDSVVITDPEGAIEYVNPAFERVTGYTRAEVLGGNPRILKSGHHDAAFYKAMWDTLLAGRVWTGRLVNRRKDGVTYTEDVSIVPVHDSSGRTVSYAAVKRDVTKQIELEAQYLQAQKMEGVGRLAAGVAHDFNNLLTIINGSAELALLDVPADTQVAEDLRQIQGAGVRASALTRQLLAFSRQQIVTPVVLNPDKVLEGFRTMLRRLITEDVQLDVRLNGGGAHVKVDPGQLEQIVLNLAVNARDAMPHGGQLTLETAPVDLDAAAAAALRPPVAAGRFACLAVADTGSGMTADVLARIFTPFFTTKDLGKGTGLGLSTVLRIVAESGGGLRVTSQPGTGSRFEVLLPCVEAATGAVATSPAPASASLGALHVLVVEDEDPLRQLAARVLKQAGHTVLTAANGRQALIALDQHPGAIDLVMTDVVMPEMGGRDLAEAMAARFPDLPVLFASGYMADPDLAAWLSRSSAPFLPKPYSPEALVRTVRDVVDRHRAGLIPRSG